MGYKRAMTAQEQGRRARAGILPIVGTGALMLGMLGLIAKWRGSLPAWAGVIYVAVLLVVGVIVEWREGTRHDRRARSGKP
jgi:hypothetical protein